MDIILFYGIKYWKITILDISELSGIPQLKFVEKY